MTNGFSYRATPPVIIILSALAALAALSGYPMFSGRVQQSFILLFVLGLVVMIAIPPCRLAKVLHPKLSDIGLAILMVCAIISAAMQPNSKTVFYLLSYGISFVGMAYFLRNIFEHSGLKNWLLMVNLIAVIIVSVIGVVEFFSETLGFDISESLYKLGVRATRGNSLYVVPPGTYVGRVYSLATEPTYLGWYYNTLGLIGIGYLWLRSGLAKPLCWAATVIIGLSYSFTFSSVTFILLIASCIVAFLLGFARHWFLSKDRNEGDLHVRYLLAGIIAVVSIYFGLLIAAEKIIGFRHEAAGASAIVEKLGFNTTSNKQKNNVDKLTDIADVAKLREEVKKLKKEASRVKKTPPVTDIPKESQSNPARPIATKSKPVELRQVEKNLEAIVVHSKVDNFRRLDIWKKDFKDILDRPFFGYGPGMLSSVSRGSSLNAYLFIGLEAGLIAVAGLCFFFLITFIDMLRSNRPFSLFFLAGMLAGTLHMMTMSQYYYASIWVFIAFFYLNENGDDSSLQSSAPING